MDRYVHLSPLESLNYDVRIAILAACHSFDDLAALIRASPTFFDTFLSTKKMVLLYVSGNILGPATRDAALLAKTSLYCDDHLDRHVDEVVQDYKARLRVTGPPWVKTIDAETAVTLVRVTRLVQFCVDIFGYVHCLYFVHDMDPTENGALLPQRARLSRREYARIAQAVLRMQILILISGAGWGCGGDTPQFARASSSLFQVWEWHQISDMSAFLGRLLYALRSYHAGRKRRVSYENWKHAYGHNLDAYVQRVKSDLSVDQSVLDFLCQKEWLFSGTLHPGYGSWFFLRGSHCTTTPLPDDDAHSDKGSDGNDSGEEAICGQPWAWRDALQGMHTCRWGVDVVKKHFPDSPDFQEYEKAKEALASWSWFGMVYWDRERAEKLKQTEALESCQTGWLVPWQD